MVDEVYLQAETWVVFYHTGKSEITGIGRSNVMTQAYQERIKNFNTISERHVQREIEGFNSWRHFVVHQDRGWLLNAFAKIQAQVEKVRQASGDDDAKQVFEAEVAELLGMFEEERLKYLGDENT